VKSPVTLRELLWPRSTGSGARISPVTPSTAPPRHAQRVDAVAELEGQPAAFLRLARAPFERFDDAGTGAPGDVEPRHRIAVAHRVIAATLGPADHGKDRMAHRAQPAALLAGGEADIGFGPASGPKILVAIEPRRSRPVLQRQVETVLDAEPALFGAVDQKQAAERPEGLAAEALLAFLVEHDDAFAGIGDFAGGNEARETAADHNYVRIVSHSVSPNPEMIKARGVCRGQRQTRAFERARCASEY
jgi:hypothetical protein